MIVVMIFLQRLNWYSAHLPIISGIAPLVNSISWLPEVISSPYNINTIFEIAIEGHSDIYVTGSVFLKALTLVVWITICI